MCSAYLASFDIQGVVKGAKEGPGLPNSWNYINKYVFNKRTIKVCVSCSCRCSGTSAPSAAHLMVSLFLCSSGSNARGVARALEGRRVSSKSPSRVRDGDEGAAGRNRREWSLPNERSLLVTKSLH